MQYGRYRIVKELGKGSMGVVYQAHDPQIDRSVALKVLRPDRVTSETFRHRFLKEARAVGRLSHPNIVVVYDIGEDHGTVYISMSRMTISGPMKLFQLAMKVMSPSVPSAGLSSGNTMRQ